MYFNNFRLYQTVQMRHKKTNLFYGTGYHLDIFWNIDDRQLDLDASPPRITHQYRYQDLKGINTEKYSQSGLSANATFDSRDNVVNPMKDIWPLSQLGHFRNFWAVLPIPPNYGWNTVPR